MADVNNIQIQQQISSLLEAQQKTIRENTRLFQQQANLTKQIANTISAGAAAEDAAKKAQNVNAALSEGAEKARLFGEQNQISSNIAGSMFEQFDDGFDQLLEKYGKGAKAGAKWAAAVGGFVSGVRDGVMFLSKGMQGVIQIAGTLVTGIFSISKAILSIPFKIFNAFVDLANAGGGGTQLAQAYEDVRKEFGDFGEDMSKNVIESARSMRGELANTGLSVWRTAGMLYERLNLIRELATEMGAAFNVFGNEITNQIEHFVAYQKGLGLSGEMMVGMSSITQKLGGTLEETLRTTAKFSTTLGKQFGVSQKVIARDVGEMSKDLKTFGSVGVRQMSQLSVYARQLGTDFKALLGVVEQFDNFDTAAESAARLAQAFGLNVDVMKIMNAQDPGERIEMLRKQFFSAGKSIENMTRQERNYLAQTTGIEDAALNSVFALKNQGKTYEEIQSAGQAAESQQITQAEAMQRLSGSIERLVRAGRRGGGFFDRFMRGFKFGIRWSRDFYKIIWDIRRALRITEYAGRRVGRAFVKMFPGVQQALKGVRDFFNPKKFRMLANGVVKSFKQFFQDLADPKTSKQALGNLLDNLRAFFKRMIKLEIPALGDVVSGFRTAFRAVGQIILSAIDIAVQNTTKLVKALTKVVSGELDIKTAFAEAFDKGGTAIGGVMSDLINVLADQLWPNLKILGGALQEFFFTALDKAKDAISDWWSKVSWNDIFKAVTSKPGMILAGIIFGPAFARTAMAAIGKIFTGQALKGSLGSGAASLGRYIGPLLANPITLAVAGVAAAIGGMYLYARREINALNAQLIGQADAAASLAEEKNLAAMSRLSQLNTEKDLIEVLGDTEKKNAVEVIKLLKEKNKISKEQIEIARQQQNAEFEQKLAQLEKKRIELEDKANTRQFAGDVAAGWSTLGFSSQRIAKGKESHVGNFFGDAFGGNAAKQELEALEAQKMGIINQRLKMNKELYDEKKNAISQEELMRRQAAESSFEQMKKAITGDSLDFSEADLGLYNKIKKLDASKVRKTVQDFDKNVKPLLVNDLRNSMLEIGKVYSDDKDSIMNAVMVMGVVSKFSSGVAGIVDNFEIAAKSYKKLPQIASEVGSPEFVGQMTDSVRDIVTLSNNIFQELSTADVSGTDSEGNIKPGDLPVVRAISGMVMAANKINSDLSSISKVNVKPKLENLGKALGIKGSDKLSIEHQNFKVDINVHVALDPTKLADSVVETGKVMKGTKS